MKRIVTFFLALVLLVGTVPMMANATRISGSEVFCTACNETGDLDGNGKVEPADAMHLLSYVLFPNRYSVLEHAGHTGADCQECLAAGDLKESEAVDTDDVMYLLYRTLFPEDSKYALPGCTCAGAMFVGYARVDITPEGTMEIYGSTASSAHDPLQMTCTAVDDGDNTVLLFSLDLRSFSADFTKTLTDIIEKQFRIPAEQVLFNITHTHSTPTITNGTAAGKQWRQKIMEQLVVVVREALADLDQVEGAYVGTGHTSGVTFVRRYLMPDGTYKTNPSSSSNPVAHETEADNEMRTLRIDRKNKKDIVMVNYQTHYGSATGLYPEQYSADFIHEFRDRVEADEELDCHFVYHSGASGNLNFNSQIPGERKYPDFIQAVVGINNKTQDANGGKGLIPTMKECLAGEEKISFNKIRFASSLYAASVYQDTEEDIANAKIVHSSGYDTDSAEYKALCTEYGFDGYRHVQGIITRSNLGETLDLPFHAISFGELAFASSPYEMFDTNGKEVREGSPFKMTFVCSYTNGGYGYMPSATAFPHKAYEVYVSRFVPGTGELCAQEMVRLLEVCKNAD